MYITLLTSQATAILHIRSIDFAIIHIDALLWLGKQMYSCMLVYMHRTIELHKTSYHAQSSLAHYSHRAFIAIWDDTRHTISDKQIMVCNTQYNVCMMNSL